MLTTYTLPSARKLMGDAVLSFLKNRTEFFSQLNHQMSKAVYFVWGKRLVGFLLKHINGFTQLQSQEFGEVTLTINFWFHFWLKNK